MRFTAHHIARHRDARLQTAMGLDAACCGAGDLLPTFVTPDDARRYIDEVDVAYARLDSNILASSVPTDFKTSWGIQLTAWKTFAVSAKATVGWLNTTAVMQQTDRFSKELRNWYEGFKAVGGTPVGPGPLPPGQGVPNPDAPSIGNITQLALVIGGVAALLMFGSKLARRLL